MLEVKNGSFGYPREPELLKNINLHLNKGKILSILGPNGVGKTTLLKCMINLQKWRTGATYLYGENIAHMKPRKLWSQISYIPQNHGFSFSFTGLEMVMMGRSAHMSLFEQPSEKEMHQAEEMMARIGISRLRDKDCNKMSGGELQMVRIAKALMNEPKLIILDEPETGLDFHNQILVLNMVEQLAVEHGISAIINTHYPTNALSISNYSLMLNKTGTPLFGKTSEILTEKNISHCFNVKVAVSTIYKEGKKVKSIVPIALNNSNEQYKDKNFILNS